VEYFKPKAFVMENVPTMGTKDKGRLFDDIIARIIQLEYTPRFSILNAVNFGVPQTRKRLFIVGIRNERRQFEFPKETHCSLEDQEKISCLKRFTTVDDAISDLPKIHDGIREHHLPYSQVNPITEYQKQLRRGQTVVGNNVCRMSNERAKKIFSFMEQGAKYMDLDPEIRKILPFREDIFHDRLKRLSLNKPSWTVLAHIGMDGYMYIHPTDDRTLSVREAARIQSFDDCFEFMGNMREQYVQVGNSVPPLLAKKIAESIQKTLNGKG
jgi:DNA (cytosine-5)-methyltransferase 1